MSLSTNLSNDSEKIKYNPYSGNVPPFGNLWKSGRTLISFCFQGIPNENIGSIWVKARLTPNTHLERDEQMPRGTWCLDTRQNKVLFHKYFLGFKILIQDYLNETFTHAKMKLNKSTQKKTSLERFTGKNICVRISFLIKLQAESMQFS